MLDQGTRSAILTLRDKGQGIRAIAHALGVSRDAVRAVIRRGTAEVPAIEREELPAAHHAAILELFVRCKGHLGRVHEELVVQGATYSYQALTAYCRRHDIGQQPKLPSGRYEFAPGKEMQHDTSPHKARIGGVLGPVQTASGVLCYSRLLFFQMYPRFTRFECKIFLDEANAYFGGAAETCMIDNTHVVVLTGTGSQMVPVPEMESFGERYGFRFVAHEKGDANRSARVEAPFHWIERNFLAGREFRDWEHLNTEARLWCDKVNAARSSKLGASRRELFAFEQPHLIPRPIWVPDIYRLHHRFVDAEGYINLNRVRYSAPYQLMGKCLEVRELRDRVLFFDGPRQVAAHKKSAGSRDERVADPGHRPPRGLGRSKEGPPPELAVLLRLEPRLGSFVTALRASASGRGTLALRRLLTLLREYPRDSFMAAVADAEKYQLFDLTRLERMVLRRTASEYFVLNTETREEYGQHE